LWYLSVQRAVVSTRARIQLVIVCSIEAVVASRANGTTFCLTLGSVNYPVHSSRAFTLDSADAVAPLGTPIVNTEFTSRGTQISIFTDNTLFEPPVAVHPFRALHQILSRAEQSLEPRRYGFAIFGLNITVVAIRTPNTVRLRHITLIGMHRARLRVGREERAVVTMWARLALPVQGPDVVA